jgi:DNA-binding transcriptional ArsR family regulator
MPRKRSTPKAPPGQAPRPSAPRQAELVTLTELDQVRVLADPLRLRIVEQLCLEERTTKQVADALGEKPTKLYHHVEALEKVGLIRQTRTRQNRGTLERYYLATARAFKADPTLFGGERSRTTAKTMRSMVATIFETTARELDELAASDAEEAGGDADKGVLSFLQVRTDEATMRRLTRRLQKLLADLQALDEGTPEDGGDRRYRLTLAFYPLDRKS